VKVVDPAPDEDGDALPAALPGAPKDGRNRPANCLRLTPAPCPRNRAHQSLVQRLGSASSQDCQAIYLAASNATHCSRHLCVQTMGTRQNLHSRRTRMTEVVVEAIRAAAGLEQDNWRWCNKCQGLAFAGNSSPGTCPAGQTHDHSGSGNYRLVQNTPVLLPSSQDNWRWCNKCQGLAFGGSASPGTCPAGGSHDHAGSGNYDLIQNTSHSIPETQDNWRWCNRCQGLSFGGSASQGTCPAGGTHNHKGSGNYVLIKT
jgi:hypothetical protein